MLIIFTISFQPTSSPTTTAPQTQAPTTSAPTTAEPTKSLTPAPTTSSPTPAPQTAAPTAAPSNSTEAATTSFGATAFQVFSAPESYPTSEPTTSAPTHSCVDGEPIWWFNPNVNIRPEQQGISSAASFPLEGACQKGGAPQGFTRYCTKYACCADQPQFSGGSCAVYFPPTVSPTVSPTIKGETRSPTSAPTSSPTKSPNSTPSPTSSTPAPTTCEERQWYFDSGRKICSNDKLGKQPYATREECCKVIFSSDGCAWCNDCKAGECGPTPPPTRSPTKSPTDHPTPKPTHEPSKSP